MDQVYAALEKVASAIEELGDRLGEWVSEKVAEQAPPLGASATNLPPTTGANADSVVTVTTTPAEPQPEAIPPTDTPAESGSTGTPAEVGSAATSEPTAETPEQAEPQPEQAEPPAEPETPPTV